MLVELKNEVNYLVGIRKGSLDRWYALHPPPPLRGTGNKATNLVIEISLKFRNIQTLGMRAITLGLSRL